MAKVTKETRIKREKPPPERERNARADRLQ